jgi:uncharacterized membrane protein
MAADHDDVAADAPHPVADKARLVAFSDGVLSIAITLLVFDLAPSGVRPGRLLHELLRQWPAYLAYLTSFGYLAVIWLNHHTLFNRVDAVDRGVKWANFAVLMTSSAIPFPTAMISDAVRNGDLADERAAVALYGLVGAVMCASWLLLYHAIRNRPALHRDDADVAFFHEGRVRAGIGVVAYLVAAALGVVTSPVVALVIFLLLPPFYAVTAQGLRDSPLPAPTAVLGASRQPTG